MPQHFQIRVIAQVIMDIKNVVEIIIKALLEQNKLFLNTVVPCCGIRRPQLFPECNKKTQQKETEQKKIGQKIFQQRVIIDLFKALSYFIHATTLISFVKSACCISQTISLFL